LIALTKSLDNERDWKNASGFFKKEYIMVSRANSEEGAMSLIDFVCLSRSQNHFLATMSKPVISLMNGVACESGAETLVFELGGC